MSEPENFTRRWDYLQEIRRELTIMLGPGWIVTTRQVKCSVYPSDAWMTLSASRHTRHGPKGVATGYSIPPEPEPGETPLIPAKEVATKLAAKMTRKIEQWLERIDEAKV